MAETCSENANTIISDYFLKSLKTIDGIQKTSEDLNHICDTYEIIARFTDNKYQKVVLFYLHGPF